MGYKLLHTILFIAIFCQLGFATVDSLNNNPITFIDKQQQRIDLFDGVADFKVTMNSDEATSKATNLYIQLVDSIELAIISSNLEPFDLKLYNSNAYLLLKNITKTKYKYLANNEKVLRHLLGLIDAKQKDNIDGFLYHDQLSSLELIPFFKYEDCSKQFLLDASKRYPADVLKQFNSFKDRPYSTEIADAIAKTAPNTAKQYFMSRSNFTARVLNSEDEVVKTIIDIFKKQKSSTKAYALLDDIVKQDLSYNAADSIAKNKRHYLQYLISIRIREDILAEHTLEKELKYEALNFVRVLNDMHLEKDPKKRFKSIEDFSAQELYTLMVYSHEEIFTSTFLGLFERMLKRMEPQTGDEFLTSLGNNKFRTFIKLCAGFNTLQIFLETMDQSAKEKLIGNFVADLEQNRGDLTNAVNVADAFGSIQDSATICIIELTIKKEYYRTQKEESKEGAAIYGLLATLFSSKSIYDKEWFAKMESEYQLPKMSSIANEVFFNKDSINVQFHLFYDDDDGYASFAAFTAQFNDAKWKITRKKYYIVLTSNQNKEVRIYANTPKYEREGHAALINLFDSTGMQPSVVVHRGHSYYVPLTVEKINNDAKVVLLGSCGGYHNLTSVLERSKKVHIISSKQIGTMLVNNPMLKQLGDELSQGNDIEWETFWEELEDDVKGNSKALEKFQDYVPPHKNLGAIFIIAYRDVIKG